MPQADLTTPDGTVPAQLVHALAIYHDHSALNDRDHQLSYGDLARFVRAFQTQLIPDGPVAIFGTPRTLLAAVAVACVISGRPFVHLDPAMPQAVLTNIVAELQVGTIATCQSAKPGQLPDHCRIVTAASCLSIDPGDAPLTAAAVEPGDIIYLVATSGTTGRPKCIPVTHDAAYLSYLWRDTYTPYDPAMKVGIYIFAIWELFRPLRNGSELYFPDLNDLMSPQALVAFIARAGLDEMLFTPSFFEKALGAIDPQIGTALPLRRVILNGEMVSDRLVTEARRKLPGSVLWNLYSICETHDISMTCLNDDTAPLSVGVAMPHLRAVVLDDHDQPCPPGQTGLLHFQGPRMLGPGYINRPEETAQRFRTLVLTGKEQRLYDTGDQGFVTTDGQIHVLGRVAHMLKLRGHSIQTRELTQTLAAQLDFDKAIPWVQHSDSLGQVLVLYYTADTAARAKNAEAWHITDIWQRTPQALAETLAAVLPRYCIPGYLVRLDEIPLNPVSGKCDFKALPALPQTNAHAPEDADLSPAIQFAARILGCPAGQIDPLLSFHDLGGDSLMCVDLLLALEQAYGRTVDFDWALNLPLSRLHELLTQAASAPQPADFSRKGILLTGVTGFLGGHVLAEAARYLPPDQVIYCLVRPRNNDPMSRLLTRARALGVADDRVALVAGAIDDPCFGLDRDAYDQLAANIGSVIHCAANVNLAVDRQRMEAWSQSGTATIVQFCRDAGAPLAFSSSTSVFPDQGGPFPEAATALFDDISGYGAAKIAAEAAIAQAGIAAAIIRLPSLYDLDAPNPKDIYETILHACARSGRAPDGLHFKMTDVRAAAALLLRAGHADGVSYLNLIADDAVAPSKGTISATDWLNTAPISAPELRFLRDNPSTLQADARYDNARAKALWQALDLGPFAQISQVAQLLARRFGPEETAETHQSDPALT